MAAFIIFVYNLLGQTVKKGNGNDIYVHVRIYVCACACACVCVCVCRIIHLSKDRTLICGNKMPTRCNRGFHCRSSCLLNMFQAPLCPSSGAQEYYTVVAACGISCCGFQVAGLLWS